MNISEIANTFEDMITQGEIKFIPATIDQLDEFPKLVVHTFLEEHKLSWSLGDRLIEQAICIKVEDPYLQYLDIYPETMQFQWSTDNHRVGVYPDDAGLYLLKLTYPNLEIEKLENGMIKVGNLTIMPKTQGKA